jgi:hypothetical protein
LKTFILVVAAAASVGLSLPAIALAQDAPAAYPDAPGAHEMRDRPSEAWPLDRREDWLASRIDRAMDHGRLSGNEEQRGRSELDAIRSEQARLVARDGGALTETDRSYLAHRIDELNGTLRWTGENPPPPWVY